MKYMLVVASLMGLASVTAAQPESDAAERARIRAQRAAAESLFQAEEKACYAKFAVNDCLQAAKAKRRAVVADLRRQEILLNDAQRRRKAAERLREAEQRASAQSQKPARAAQPAGEAGVGHKLRPARTHPKQVQPSPAKPAQADGADRTTQAAESRARHQQRLRQAQERKARLEKRLAERDKPAAQPLPVPP